ncbi:MAG TPA: hypothetical protein VHB20_01890 [Verrucomicrobiae bacterium]|jgi:hypothetical protein|nr:hypothetical protein [Verrucomicrobiae bacterium]
MKIKFWPHLGAALLGSVLLSACQSAPPHSPPEPERWQATRNNCYSLLHQLLDQEKDVSKLRFIKHEDANLKNLLKKVSDASRAAAAHLELFAKDDPALALEEYRLPAGEKMTRDSISAAEQNELLKSSGDQLEMILILTQVEALNYASHLAKVAAENDLQPERARYLKGLSHEMSVLHEEVIGQLSLRR